MRALAPCDEAWACRPPPRSPPPAGVSHVAGLLCGFVACEGPARPLADPASSVQRHAPRLGGDRHLGLGGQIRRQSAGRPMGAADIDRRRGEVDPPQEFGLPRWRHGRHPSWRWAGRQGRTPTLPKALAHALDGIAAATNEGRTLDHGAAWWARRTLWERRRSLGLVVVSSNCRSSVPWVSGKGGRVREVAIVPFRKEEHHPPLYSTANIFWKHLGRWHLCMNQQGQP